MTTAKPRSFQPDDDKGADRVSLPSDNLKHFTNRVAEQEAFDRLLRLETVTTLPVLMFYGVGGSGKTWLLKRLQARASHAGLPTARLDIDNRIDSEVAKMSPADRLLFIRKQFGQEIACLRFDLAYCWLLAKYGKGAEPPFKGGTALGILFEYCLQLAQATNETVIGSLALWITGKFRDKVIGNVVPKSWSDWLIENNEEEIFRDLKKYDEAKLRAELAKYLLQDLDESLPRRQGLQCRGVIFIDTFESSSLTNQASHAKLAQQKWVQDLHFELSPFLIVIGGRDHLRWDEDDSTYFNQREYLEQHCIGGLSENDSLRFLEMCNIKETALQNAILRVCRFETPSPQSQSHTDHRPEVGHHTWKLGLCADSVLNDQKHGIVTNPDSFSFDTGDNKKLAERFLQSMGTDRTYEVWLRRLAYPLRLDSLAARFAFSPNEPDSVTANAAWESLLEYSFISETPNAHWNKIHPSMRAALLNLPLNKSGDAHALQKQENQFWLDHFTNRSTSDVDDYAGLAWYHQYRIDPNKGIQIYTELAKVKLSQLDMHAHYSITQWPLPVIADQEVTTVSLSLRANLLLQTGIQLWQATTGDRSANLKQAIESYEQALEVYTKEDFPTDWALTKNNLGLAYWNLPTGDRNANLKQAIVLFEQALEVQTKEDFPTDWAMTKNNLGNVYWNLPTGDRSANLKQAIASYEQALEVQTKEDFPTDWARTKNNLGTAYSDLPTGDRSANLKQAIASYEQALEVQTKEDFPTDWARTKNNLGLAYWNLPTGDRSANLKQAIESYEQALEVRTKEDFPTDWAMTKNNLGVAYWNLPTGDRNTNLKQAIASYEQALEVYTKEDFPTDWAMSKNNLGLAYRNLPTGDRNANLTQAIASYKQALEVRTKENFPTDWAMTKNNLGLAYSDLPTGDRNANLKQAIESYKQAQEVYTKEDFPTDWAATKNNLGLAYSDLPTGDRSANLKQAIESYEQALEVYTKENFPTHWAATKNNLAYLLATTDEAEIRKPDVAVRYAKEAVSVFGSPNFLDTLATAYAANGELDLAIETIEKGLTLAEGDLKTTMQTQLEAYRKKKDSHG